MLERLADLGLWRRRSVSRDFARANADTRLLRRCFLASCWSKPVGIVHVEWSSGVVESFDTCGEHVQEGIDEACSVKVNGQYPREVWLSWWVLR
jgi:hypothetical protein